MRPALPIIASMALVSAIAQPVLGQAVETPIVFKPAGKWQLAYEKLGCNLSRPFAAGDARALFLLELKPLTKSTLKVGFSGQNGNDANGDAVFLIDDKRVPGTVPFHSYEANDHRVFSYHLDNRPLVLSELQSVLRIEGGKERPFELSASDFKMALSEANKCMTELNLSFGISQTDALRAASPPSREWIPSFLPNSIRPSGEFDYLAVYWVDQLGRVDECKLISSSVGDKFDAGFCAALRANARFKPGLDAAGNPVRTPVVDQSSIRIAPLPR